MTVVARVQHLNHAGVVQQTFENFGEVPLGYKFVKNDVGECNYGLAIAEPKVTRDGFAAKANDYIIQCSRDGVNWESVQGGICGPIGLKSHQQHVTIVGYDWGLYTEQPWDFDYDTISYADIIADPQLLLKGNSWFKQSQTTVITDLLANLYDGTSETIQFSPTFLGSGWSEVLNKQIMFQDETTILDHIRGLAEADAPFGFDFYFDYDKSVILYAPGRNRAVTPAISAHSPSSPNGLIDMDWQNTGPISTRTLGIGPDGSPGLFYMSTFAGSTAQYRKWLRIQRLSANYGATDKTTTQEMIQSRVNSVTASIGYRDRFPHHDLVLTIQPDLASSPDPLLFFRNQTGQVVFCDSERTWLNYHRVQANFWITEQALQSDKTGKNWTCTLGLDQVPVS